MQNNTQIVQVLCAPRVSLYQFCALGHAGQAGLQKALLAFALPLAAVSEVHMLLDSSWHCYTTPSPLFPLITPHPLPPLRLAAHA